MNVLVTAASRHGSTEEIARAIVEALRSHRIEASFSRPEQVAGLAGIDAVVLGSGVYIGSWLKEARDFAERHGEALASLPVWLFSSGPLGVQRTRPVGDARQVAGIVEATHARGHRVFAGRLDRRRLGLGEKLIARLVRAPEGDFRDWEAIHAWAGEIAATLVNETAPARARVR